MSDLRDNLERLAEATRKSHRIKVLGRLEIQLGGQMRKAFQAQGKAMAPALAALTGKVKEAAADDLDAAINKVLKDTADSFAEPIQTTAESAMDAGGAVQAAEFSVSWTLENPRAVAYLENYGAGQVTQIEETTRTDLRALMAEALAQGWSNQKTQKAIQQKYAEWSRSRAKMIAIYEPGAAYCEGNRIVALDLQAAGLKMSKAWLTAGDKKVTQQCKDNAAEGRIPLDQEHTSGHQRPPRFPRCRCDELYYREAK